MRNFCSGTCSTTFRLKLLALALAVALWLAVARDPVAEVAMDVPIEFHNIPENLEISYGERAAGADSGARSAAGGAASATGGRLGRRRTGGMKPGERTFDLTADQIHQPKELEVVQIIPSEFHLTFDARLTRQVPVHPRVAGNSRRATRSVNYCPSLPRS